MSNNSESGFQISAFQRMLSACAGSLINSFAVTPFDVVRIRLQQQELLNNGMNQQIPQGCCRVQPVFWLSPIDCSSPCATVNPQSVKITGTWQGLKFIGLNEGFKTLWKGVSLALFITIPGNMVYFAGYDHLKERMTIVPNSVSPLVAGALARTAAVITISPVELIKTRLQAMPTMEGKTDPLLNLLKDTSRSVMNRGPGILFKGLELTLWRDVPFSAIYWLSYEFCKGRITSFHNRKATNDVAIVSFLSGSISGTVAAICTNPFDVGKTRLQVAADEPRNKLIKKKRPSMLKFFQDIIKKEGFSALYVGLIPRILKIAPSCAVMISSYEISKHYFYKRYLEKKV